MQTNKTRKLTITALLAAISTVLMFPLFQFSVPLMPGYIKFDFSELPALIAAFSMGPISGVTVCLVKNLIHLMMSDTGGVGELSNFVLGSAFVLPAGIIYKLRKTRKFALIGSLSGALLMAVISLFTNYYIVYPIYMKLFMPRDVILSTYQAIMPSVDSLWKALLIFNVPFTFLKGLASVIITLLIYKKISPILKGKHI